jgi:putative addiction module killer protein
MYQIDEYVTADGRRPFGEWLAGLRDRRAQARLLTRLDRVQLGNPGDCKALPGTGGMAELRDPHGPGYSVYFAIIDGRVVLLLAGSTKQDQAAAIRRATAYLADYRTRS